MALVVVVVVMVVATVISMNTFNAAFVMCDV